VLWESVPLFFTLPRGIALFFTTPAKIAAAFYRLLMNGELEQHFYISAIAFVVGLGLSILVGLPVGILSAFKPNSMPDGIARTLSVLFIAIPGFWLGMLIVLALLFWFGYKAPIIIVHVWQDPWQNLQIVIGPGIVLGLAQGAYIARMSRSCLLEVISEDFVRTARAKGLAERWVVIRHALRNALIPIVTLLGLQMGQLLGGAVLTETVFAWPGLGRVMVRAIFARDYILLQGAVLIFALAFVVVNLIVDLSYAYLDPRVGKQG